MDSSLAPLPEAFLRRKLPETDDRSPLADDGGPPPAGGPLSNNAVAESSGWGLGGISQMRWPAWRREQGGGDGGLAATDDTANAAIDSAVVPTRKITGSTPKGQGREVNGQGKNNSFLGRRPVGPFGNGTGAAGRPPVSSGLFGDMEDSGATTGSGIASARSADSWRRNKAGGTGGGAFSGSVDKPKSGATKDTGADWLPVLEVGSGVSGSGRSVARFGRDSAPPQHIASPDDDPFAFMIRPPRLGSGSGPGAAAELFAEYSAEDAVGSGTGESGWPPERGDPAGARAAPTLAVSVFDVRGGRVDGDGRDGAMAGWTGGAGGGNEPPSGSGTVFSGFAGGNRVVTTMGLGLDEPVGQASAFVSEGVTAAESSDEEEDENPFA